MPNILESFVNELKIAYHSNLKTIILYGSKAESDENSKNSDYNILLILDEVKPQDILSLGKIVVSWVKNGNQPPLLFSEKMFLKSADVFPIEFLDMKDNHKILYGQDLLADMIIKDTHLRHECEFELKGKLLKLRQGYMLSCGKSQKIWDLLLGSISSVLVVFRHVVKFIGINPPLKKIDSLNILAKNSGIDASIFISIMRIKQGDNIAKKINPNELMDKYILEIEKVVNIVDNLN